MFRMIDAWAAVLALAIWLVPARAFATAWSVPVVGCPVTLGYGVSYAGGTHRGIDLAAEASSLVAAPVAGRVMFAGDVPADGGGTCGAVTIALGDGMRVTLLPLAEVYVGADDVLGAGEAVGTLGASGDDSSAGSHVHMSLRRGDVYLDPTPFLPLGAPPVEVVEAAPAAPSETPACGVVIAAGTAASITGVVAAPVTAAVPVVAAPSISVASRPAPHPVPESAGIPRVSAIEPGLGGRTGQAALSGLVPVSAVPASLAAVALTGVAFAASRRHTVGVHVQ